MVTLGQPNNDYYLSHAFPVTLKLSLPPRITIESVIITDQIKVIQGKQPSNNRGVLSKIITFLITIN